MDLIYLVGQRTFWDNQEVKFSLRSAERNLKFDKVFMVGKKPKHFNDKVIEVKIADDQGHKYFNVANKIWRMLNNKNVSDDFILMNDDFFILQEYKKIPYYYNLTLKKWIDNWPKHKGEYWNRMIQAYEHFPKGKFFELHFPIVLNKNKAIKVFKKYNLFKVAVMLRSYYCNEYYNEIKPILPSKDYKIYNYEQFMINRKAPFVSTTNETAVLPDFKNFIKSRFPQKSTFEI